MKNCFLQKLSYLLLYGFLKHVPYVTYLIYDIVRFMISLIIIVYYYYSIFK